MIYRLKAPTRQDIEEQIPFELYRKDEQGNEVECFATKQYSYVFIGHEVLEKAEYDGEEMIEPTTLSEYVLADLRIYDDTEIDFEDPVEQVDPETPMHGWT